MSWSFAPRVIDGCITPPSAIQSGPNRAGPSTSITSMSISTRVLSTGERACTSDGPPKNVNEDPSGVVSFDAQKLHAPTCDAIEVTQLTFPDHQYGPTRPAKTAARRSVAFSVARELLIPEGNTRSRHRPTPPTPMSMPVAPVNEDHLAPSGEHDVGRAGQIGPMKTISIAHAIQHLSQRQFGLRIPAVNAPHQRASGLLVESIHPNGPN